MADNEKDKLDVQASVLETTEKVASGKYRLVQPIKDGDRVYEELEYDFNKLTGWELARALNAGSDRTGSNPTAITEMQALALFAAAAGKCTEGLDATDIRERMGAADAIAVIGMATVFFRGSLLAGSLRITKE